MRARCGHIVSHWRGGFKLQATGDRRQATSGATADLLPSSPPYHRLAPTTRFQLCPLKYRVPPVALRSLRRPIFVLAVARSIQERLQRRRRSRPTCRCRNGSARALGPKYEVRRLLGQGGFAEVYEVWDIDLQRRLAVKVLKPDIAWSAGMLERFKHEARAIARLNHPTSCRFTSWEKARAWCTTPCPSSRGSHSPNCCEPAGRSTPIALSP